MLPRIVSVKADAEKRTVLAVFANGERRNYDVRPLLSRGVFRSLQKAKDFVAVHVDEIGGLQWENGPDLSNDTIYLDGQPA